MSHFGFSLSALRWTRLYSNDNEIGTSCLSIYPDVAETRRLCINYPLSFSFIGSNQWLDDRDA
jgi:hypothetical protein